MFLNLYRLDISECWNGTSYITALKFWPTAWSCRFCRGFSAAMAIFWDEHQAEFRMGGNLVEKSITPNWPKHQLSCQNLHSKNSSSDSSGRWFLGESPFDGSHHWFLAGKLLLTSWPGGNGQMEKIDSFPPGWSKRNEPQNLGQMMSWWWSFGYIRIYTGICIQSRRIYSYIHL